MFRNRRSSQKPDDDFIANFRQSFPEVRTGNPVVALSSQDGDPTSLDSGAQATATNLERTIDDGSETNAGSKDVGATSKPPAQDPFRFTPSVLDVNSFAFSSLGSQPPGYYTPTPGGVNTLYHPQAGDLHTPSIGLGMGLGTPLSMPTSSDGLHISSMLDLSAFTSSMSSAFSPYNPYLHGVSTHSNHQQGTLDHDRPTSFAPSSFVHQDTGYETMEHDGSPFSDDGCSRMESLNAVMHQPSPIGKGFLPPPFESTSSSLAAPSTGQFRFHAVLNAPTAMIRHSDEIPLSYLNKGQAYSITIVDQQPHLARDPAHEVQYRTFIRVSFEDKQQRERPGVCWQLWKEGRGLNEAHQRGGRLQAVEYVESSQNIEQVDQKPRIELSSASFDGFSVLWSSNGNGRPECTVAVRFNFLSTDFSHSKGVKGIPVRLCAKTEVIPIGATPLADLAFSEVAYCKVKLFRDHGAERKLSNDVAHVKKTIDKLKQQIAQAEAGLKDGSKRKRSSAAAKNPPSERPGKVQKHKRTWSMSSGSSASGKAPAEDDLHYKLRTMQDMFTSTRPASVFFLRGAPGDDPDLYPVSLPKDGSDLLKMDPLDTGVWQHRPSIQSLDTNHVSPSMSQASPPSALISAVSATHSRAPWADFPPSASRSSSNFAKPTDTTRNQIASVSRHGVYFEATGVDDNYVPPAERTSWPVACFYVQHRPTDNDVQPSYHRAVYLTQRTLSDFHAAIAAKWNLDPTRIRRSLHVLDRGLEIEMDDDVIRELKEGQDAIFEILQVDMKSDEHGESSVKSETPAGKLESAAPQVADRPGYELRFFF